jgi:hypothetical protein
MLGFSTLFLALCLSASSLVDARLQTSRDFQLQHRRQHPDMPVHEFNPLEAANGRPARPYTRRADDSRRCTPMPVPDNVANPPTAPETPAAPTQEWQAPEQPAPPKAEEVWHENKPETKADWSPPVPKTNSGQGMSFCVQGMVLFMRLMLFVYRNILLEYAPLF